MSEKQLQCYHLGCQQLYDPEQNTITSCVYHPGTPFFHDAYKGWSCCQKKCVDFTEFLNIKGCTTGYHSNEKPPEPEKKTETKEVDDVPQPVRPPVVAKKRPPIDTPMTDLVPTVTQALKNAVYNVKETSVETQVAEVQIGDPCLHNGCKEKYIGPESDSSACQHHPGVPIFHEGMKYWSCCKKKTMEFEAFENQKGCTTGSHQWRKGANEKQTAKCRVDYVQTGGNMTVILYAKKCHPEKSTIKLNPVKLSVDLCFPEENASYTKTWILCGIVEPQESTVTMTPNKIEIALKKAEPVRWSNLDLPAEKAALLEELSLNEVKKVGVEPVDLSDL